MYAKDIDKSFEAVRDKIGSVPLLDSGAQFFWENVTNSIILKTDMTREDLVYKLPDYSTDSIPLWTFLEIGQSQLFGNLCKNDNQYHDGTVVDFCIFSNINGTKEKPKLVRESLAFFKAVFDKENYGCLDEVCSNGCHLVVHMTDNYGSMQVISAVVFAIMPCGIWINFLASKSAKFLGTHYSNGDNIPFDKRGLGLFMIKQLYHLAVQLEDKRLISSAKIYLKTPEKRNQTTQEKSLKEKPQQTVSRFYKKLVSRLQRNYLRIYSSFAKKKGDKA